MLANLVKVFMVSQEGQFILLLIQKILDFKSWVVGCLKDGFETLVRHIDMHLLKNFVDSLG
jgi:hypothetical protein